MNQGVTNFIRSAICFFALLFFSTSAHSLQITGTIALPNNNTVSGNTLEASVDVFVRDSNGFIDFFASGNTNVAIVDGTGQANFSIDFDSAPSDGTYEIFVTCFANCGPYIGQSYLPGGVFAFRSFLNPPITPAELPTMIDFVLVEGVEVTTTISLPDGEVANGDISNSVNFRVSAPDSFLSIFSDGPFVTIPDQESSVTFSYAVPTVPDGGTYTIESRCQDNCGVFTTLTQYLQEDGTNAFGRITNVDPNVLPFPQTLNFTLVEGQTVSGQVSLPDGFTATGPIDVSFQITELSSEGDFLSNVFERVTIDFGNTSANFSLSFIPKTDSVYLFSYGCETFFSDCQTLLRVEQQFYTPGGVVTRATANQADLAATDIAETVNLILTEGEIVSGTISLSDDIPAATDMQFEVNLSTMSPSSLSLGLQFITLSKGQNSTNYQLVHTPLEPNEQVSLSASCRSDCGVFQGQSLYLQADGSVDSTFAEVNTIPQVLNFEFLQPRIISGVISLPDGFVAIQDTVTNISVTAYADLAGQEFVDSRLATITIPVGNQSAPFSVPISDNPDGSLRISFGCQVNATCGAIASNTQYTPSGISNQTSNEVFPTNTLPSIVELPLQLGRRFSGQLQIPNGVTPPTQNLNFNVSIFILDENQLLKFAQTDFVTLISGQRSADFAIVLPQVEPNDQIQITYGCRFGAECDEYLSGIFHLPSGATFDRSLSVFPVSDLPAGELDLELIQGIEFSGSIELPNSTLASSDLLLSIDIGVQNSQGETGTTISREVTITENSNSATFSIPAPPITEGTYTVSYGCNSFFGQDCGNLINNVFFTPNGTAFTFEQGRIPFADLPRTATLTLVEGEPITGTLVLPEGATATDEISSTFFGVNISSVDESGVTVASQFQGSSVNIPVGANQSEPFEVLVPPIEGTRFRINYSCFDSSFNDCGSFVRNYFHTSTGPVYSLGDAELFSAIPSPLELQVLPGVDANFDLRRPLSQPEFPLSVFVAGSITAFSDAGEKIGTQEFGRSIFTNQVNREFSFPLLKIPGAGRYDIEFDCSDELPGNFSSDCLAFEADATSYSFSLSSNSLPNPIVLQLLERPLPIFPDSFEVDNTPEQANSISGNRVQLRTIHEAGDVDFLTFTLADPADVLIRVENNGDEGRPALFLLNEVLSEIESNDDVLSDEELANNRLSAIERSDLEAGEYFIRIEGFSPTAVIRSYRLQFNDGTDDTLCLPIKTSSGRTSIVCL